MTTIPAYSKPGNHSADNTALSVSYNSAATDADQDFSKVEEDLEALYTDKQEHGSDKVRLSNDMGAVANDLQTYHNDLTQLANIATQDDNLDQLTGSDEIQDLANMMGRASHLIPTLKAANKFAHNDAGYQDAAVAATRPVTSDDGSLSITLNDAKEGTADVEQKEPDSVTQFEGTAALQYLGDVRAGNRDQIGSDIDNGFQSYVQAGGTKNFDDYAQDIVKIALNQGHATSAEVFALEQSMSLELVRNNIPSAGTTIPPDFSAVNAALPADGSKNAYSGPLCLAIKRLSAEVLAKGGASECLRMLRLLQAAQVHHPHIAFEMGCAHAKAGDHCQAGAAFGAAAEADPLNVEYSARYRMAAVACIGQQLYRSILTPWCA